MADLSHRQEVMLTERQLHQLEDLRRSAGPIMPTRQQVVRELIERAHAQLKQPAEGA